MKRFEFHGKIHMYKKKIGIEDCLHAVSLAVQGRYGVHSILTVGLWALKTHYSLCSVFSKYFMTLKSGKNVT